MKPSSRGFGRGGALWLALLSVACLAIVAPTFADPETIDPSTIPKFVTNLTAVPIFATTLASCGSGKPCQFTEVLMSAFDQQVLPTSFPSTPVFGYGGQAVDSVTGAPLGFVQGWPGPSFVVKPGEPTKVKWTNRITSPHLFTVDKTLVDTTFNSQNSIPVIPHVHGAEVQSTSDGNPQAYWTSAGQCGSKYGSEEPTASDSAIFIYPNDVSSSLLWYHDHWMGGTRLNTLAGLAGFYLIKRPSEKSRFPSGKYEMPLAIQDRLFNEDGSIYLNTGGNNPETHPNWNPEYFGDVMIVNGKAWPNLPVDRGAYRFRLLNGCDSRFLDLVLTPESDPTALVTWTMIGTEQGFLRSATAISGIAIAPGERVDVLVDFSAYPAGTKFILRNSAPSPYPMGDPVTPETAIIMSFTVTAAKGAKMPDLKGVLNPTLSATTFPTIPQPLAANRRSLVLVEVDGNDGPFSGTINGLPFMANATEVVTQGSTEDWDYINLSVDSHPMHNHLAAHQLVSRQTFNVTSYKADWLTLNGVTELPFPEGHVLKSLPVGPYLTGTPILPAAWERGWKDTTVSPPGSVTTIRVRFAKKNGKAFSFNPTIGPGYVYHCHILSHEDNDMMRPLIVV